MKRLFCYLILLMLVAIHTVSADTFYLKSGNQIIGTVISEDSETYVIKLIWGDEITLKKDQVESVIRSSSGTPVPINQPSSATGTVDSPTGSLDPSGIGQDATPAQTPQGSTNTLPLGDGQIPDTPPRGLDQPLLPVILPSSNAFIVIGNSVVLRSGPGINTEQIASVPGRTLVIGIEQSQGWNHVKTLEGQEGWIHPNFLTELEGTPALVTGEQLNVRNGPDDIFQTITRLRKGDVVTKVQEEEQWWRVITSDQQAGWCNSQYLKPMQDDSLIRPPMMMIRNSDISASGRQEPVSIQKIPDLNNQQNVIFNVHYEPLLMNAMTKLVVFYSDRNLFQSQAATYSSTDILSRERIPHSAAMIDAGIPEELALQYIGADVLTMECRRVDGAWQLQITAPDTPAIGFAMTVQQGEQRGMMVLLE